jgi:hypothetical protein
MNVLPYQQSVEGCRLDSVERWELSTPDARVGIQVSRSRRMPWLKIARVPRFGRGIPAADRGELLRQMVELAVRRSVLRLHVEVWTENVDELEGLESACRSHGFVPSRTRAYTHTVWMDLTPPEEELLSGFHATCRRHIRAPAKKGYEVRRIVTGVALPQLESMFRGAFARTGGQPPEMDWQEFIRQAADDSSDIHLVGLFAVDDTASRNPLAFASAVLHGQVAEYAHAGSTRDPGVRIPLHYAPTWELMRWAKARGATAWDFGGVVDSSAPDETRDGIDQFKFSFSQQITRVGSEWVLQCSRLPWPFRPAGRSHPEAA